MAAYLIGQIAVSDESQYDKYKALTPAAIEKHGGRFVVRGGEFRILEGSGDFDRVVLIEFPTLEAVEAFYNSPEYTEARAVRKGAAIGTFVAVQGV